MKSSEDKFSKFGTKKWYAIDGQLKSYSRENPIKFSTKSIKSTLCDYSDAYPLVTWNIVVAEVDNNTKVVLRMCVPFRM